MRKADLKQALDHCFDSARGAILGNGGGLTPLWMMTDAPIGVVLKISFAANIGIRTHP